MTDEQAKEITIAMIEKGNLYMGGSDNAEIAKQVASFYNVLREETKSELRKTIESLETE